jgi:hypothetical protein
MKKKLEAELISIAHRILKLKNRSEIAQLHREAQQLYEKLSVMMFVEENFAQAKPTIGRTEAEEILETAFEKKETFTPETPENADVAEVPQPEQPEIAAESTPAAETPEPESEPGSEEEAEIPVEETQEESPIEEPSALASETIREAEDLVAEKEADEVIAEAEEEAAKATEEFAEEEESTIPAEENAVEPAVAAGDDMFRPAFEWGFEAKAENTQAPKPASGQIAFEDLLGAGYVDPVFVKPEDVQTPIETKTPDSQRNVIPITPNEDKVPVVRMNNAEIADKAVSLNDRLSKGITVGLNDRIAFVKNLFGNSNEDYNRVLSQLITFNTFEEAQEFIEQMVKPDYNNWEGKDEYAQRFMEVVEKKFS